MKTWGKTGDGVERGSRRKGNWGTRQETVSKKVQVL